MTYHVQQHDDPLLALSLLVGELGKLVNCFFGCNMVGLFPPANEFGAVYN